MRGRRPALALLTSGELAVREPLVPRSFLAVLRVRAAVVKLSGSLCRPGASRSGRLIGSGITLPFVISTSTQQHAPIYRISHFVAQWLNLKRISTQGG